MADTAFGQAGTKRQRIAIIGGGIGGLTAALELSATPQQRERCDITVYQMGWRLGGKCATGRNAAYGQRIEEHGIHGFLGSYFNALTLMQRLHQEWAPPPGHPLADFAKAFPKEYAAFFWEWEGDRLLRWHNVRAPSPLPLTAAPALGTLSSWLGVAAKVLHQIAMGLRVEGIQEAAAEADMAARFDALIAAVDAAIPPNQPGTDRDGDGEPDWDWTPLVTGLDALVAFGEDKQATNLRRQWLLLELLQVMLRGVRDDRLLVKGLRSVDSEEYRHWLVRHGASPELCASPLVLATINTTYQYPGGDVTALPTMSACSWLQWTLRTFVSLEAPYYLFAAGSGDTIVAPAYEVLRRRGVKFAFFHRLRDLELNATGTSVNALHFDVQARVRTGSYEPLVTVGGLQAWPGEPDLSQLVHGEALGETDFECPQQNAPGQQALRLAVGDDFDAVVLAIPPAAIRQSASALCEAHPRWDRMARDMATTATQSAQVWLRRPVKEMDDPETVFHLAGNAVSGLHGHVDFGKFLAFEAWPRGDAPKGLLFFSGVMRDPGPEEPRQAEALARHLVRNELAGILSSMGRRLLPRAANPGNAAFENPFALDPDEIYSAQPLGSGMSRLEDQYVRANLRPSERYTQAPPGTAALRISPLDTGIANLTAAGDWVDTVLNVGSFEGAVMGGMLAARAIDTTLSVGDIIGLHPTAADGPGQVPGRRVPVPTS